MFLHLWFCSCSSFLPNSYVLFSNQRSHHASSISAFIDVFVSYTFAPCFFLHNGNSSIWGSFLGCWMMGNLVDTPKIGGREPWFPFDIPLKSTHHLPWGQGSEVFDARNALLAAKELHHLLGTPHITRGTPCFTWLSKIWLSSHDSTWQPCKMDQHFTNITRQSNFTGDG